MFVRVNKTPNSPRQSVQVVHSQREGHKVRTKIIRHVGIALNDDEVEKLKSFAYDIIATIKKEADNASSQQSLFMDKDISGADLKILTAKRQKGRTKAKPLEDILPVNEVLLDDLVEEKRIVEGVSDIAFPIYDKLGFPTLLPFKKDQAILRSLVLSRMIAPKSKRGLQRFIQDKFDEEYDLDAIYRLMDKLHPRIKDLKAGVFNRTKTLFPKGINLMLFDVTTLYFESTNTDDLRAFGYSKDHRFNTTQVVIALATNVEGLPVGYELFAGNTAEVKTLVAAIESWKDHLPIADVCFVGDRAMFCEANLKLLETKGYRYVVAAKLRSLPKALQANILNENSYKDAEFEKEIGRIGEFNYQDRRLIVSYKTKRAIKDEKDRQTILNKITKTLNKSKNTGKLITNNGIKKYTKASGTSETVLDEAKIQHDANWDGLHGVITNIPDESAQVILGHYSRLWVIEESFRINKHTLKMRPIYHWTKERIESHIALCYMSFAVLKNLQYQINLTQKVSVEEILEELMNVQASIYIHKKTNDRYRVPGHLTHKASKIYKALNLIRSQDATIYQ